jgi:hypothetical protein
MVANHSKKPFFIFDCICLKSKLIVTPPLKWDVLGAGTSSHYQKFSQNTTNLDFYYDKDFCYVICKILAMLY